MSDPRTMREALAAQMLGELDVIVSKVEALPKVIDQAEKRVTDSVNTLDQAGDKFRMAVTAYVEQAKAELTEYLQRKAQEIATTTVEEQRTAMQEAARTAFRTEAIDRAAALGRSLSDASKEFQRGHWSRIIEHGVTACLASGLTATIVWLITKQ